MPNRYTVPKKPARSRLELIREIMRITFSWEREAVFELLCSYFTTVDLELIISDLAARKDLAAEYEPHSE